ncbi:larval cuticle protein A2B-like [Chironomus tepperi]|uniref:larval cuticle protein A2B-like n=1 Tax=Chironomus tepperi TaxID=113505 RepID=UPI00391F9993
MAFKFVILCVTLAAVNAGVIETGWQPNPWNPHATTIVKQPAIVKHVVAAESPANYEFNYEVHDTHTGDIKRQHEKAENGQVSGQYSLVDPDGFRRVVSYTADAHHGFQANVQREPVSHKVVAPAHGWQAPTVTKVIAPAPAHGWQAPSHGWQAPTVTKVIAPAPAHGWQAPSHGWQAPTVTKVIAPAPAHGWQAPSHGWQAPTVVKVQAPSHGWQSNPWA